MSMDERTKTLIGGGISNEDLQRSLQDYNKNVIYNETKDFFIKNLKNQTGRDPSQSELDMIENLSKQRSENIPKTIQQELAEQKLSKIKAPDLDEQLPTSKTYIPEEKVKDIDIGRYQKMKALEKLGKAANIGGAVLGAGMAAKDISENNETNALLDLAESGVGLAGRLGARAAPFLELFRSTPTVSEEQEMEELAKSRPSKVKSMLSKQKQLNNRLPSSEE